ncbi:hypothetical protein O6H91_09G102700 [Diphasiastrum complanatum]|uniref:Uncharacterized protein n=1 Tax=Diphasiastrum complanatum TaxID=34168 RepID=A0ACC2CSF7_DIPCM|nr:hypothetical protein O6H91_09G102700 [Diphasiastrum complanatum]
MTAGIAVAARAMCSSTMIHVAALTDYNKHGSGGSHIVISGSKHLRTLMPGSEDDRGLKLTRMKGQGGSETVIKCQGTQQVDQSRESSFAPKIISVLDESHFTAVANRTTASSSGTSLHLGQASQNTPNKPEVDPDTNEMIVTGYSPFKPYLVMGVVAQDGETMLHKVDVGLDRRTLSHDTTITSRFSFFTFVCT